MREEPANAFHGDFQPLLSNAVLCFFTEKGKLHTNGQGVLAFVHLVEQFRNPIGKPDIAVDLPFTFTGIFADLCHTPR